MTINMEISCPDCDGCDDCCIKAITISISGVVTEVNTKEHILSALHKQTSDLRAFKVLLNFWQLAAAE